MFKPSTKHNIAAGPSNHPEVKLNKRSSNFGQSPSRYPHRLNFYTRPPTLDITLEEFETFAIERLRVLSHIESLQHRSLPFAQLQTQIGTYLKTHLPLSSNTARSVNLEAERRADEIGHWVLRLAFCRSPDLRARFVRSEVALFKHRFETDDQNERAEFLRGVNTQGEEVKKDEKGRIENDLRKCMWNMKEDAFQAEVFFKVSLVPQDRFSHGLVELKKQVPWYTVPDLVASRRVFIKGGMAYVPQSMQISLVLQAFAS